jgi:hypothetical protein
LHADGLYIFYVLQSAIGSAAAAAEASFVPYTERVLHFMQGFMVLTKDEDLPARARATELVGIVGMAVGRSVIEPVLPSFIEAALEVTYFVFNSPSCLMCRYVSVLGGYPGLEGLNCQFWFQLVKSESELGLIFVPNAVSSVVETCSLQSS